ncbi:MAG: FGGY-family carbohydrate kinase [Spirochaetales bacterium]|nr:FGGY-family carbohydrate kinase [Spirochaetales bacterium]
MTILAIDCGTQSLRALLIDHQGKLIDLEKVEYEPYTSPRPGWTEQDPEVFWSALCVACNALKGRLPEVFARIDGVGVTTQRDTIINVDREGDPLRPAIVWLDIRKAKPVWKPGGLMKTIYRFVGMDEAVLKLQVDGKCNWIKEHQPEIWDKTAKLLMVSGFLNYRLTGEFIDSAASQIGHIPFEYKKFRWAQKGELSRKLFPIEEEKLPAIIEPGGILGKITRSATEATGIPEGVPVVACGSDKGCETIGIGVVDESMASLSFGTTATVQTTTSRYFEALKFMPPYPAPIPNYYNPEVQIYRGYWMISWFKKEFGRSEMEEAKRTGTLPEELLNKLLTEVPPGCLGLMMQPYWTPGLRNPSARGAVIGFGDVHNRSYLYRAVIEGLGYALRDGKEKIEKAGKLTFQRVAVAGGASQSDQICQITSDILDMELLRGETYESSGLGAAVVTAAALGAYPDIPAACRAMVRHKDVFTPDRRNADIYQRLYDVYRKIYPSLEKVYEELREITRYPAYPEDTEHQEG